MAIDEATTDERCILVANSCTTGWLDWVHAELWLCSSGLVRRSMGADKTVRRAVEGGAKAITRRLPPTEEDRRALLADPKSTWIDWSDVATATLKRGIIDHSLHLVRTDGGRVKYLWAVGQTDFEDLGQRLAALLGDRFTLHRARIG